MKRLHLADLILDTCLLSESEIAKIATNIISFLECEHFTASDPELVAFLKNQVDCLSSAALLSHSRSIAHILKNDLYDTLEAATQRLPELVPSLRGDVHPSRPRRASIIASRYEKLFIARRNLPSDENGGFVQRLDNLQVRLLEAAYRIARKSPRAGGLDDQWFPSLLACAASMRNDALQELGAGNSDPSDQTTLLANYAKRRGLANKLHHAISFSELTGLIDAIVENVFPGTALQWSAASTPDHLVICAIHIGKREAGHVYITMPNVGAGVPSFTVPLASRSNMLGVSQKPFALVQCSLPRGSRQIGLQRALAFAHEMGHAVQHIGSKETDPSFSGIDSISAGYEEVVSYLFEKEFMQAWSIGIDRPDSDARRALISIKKIEFSLNFEQEVALSYLDYLLLGDSEGSVQQAVSRLNHVSGRDRHVSELLARISPSMLRSYLGRVYRYPVGHAISALWISALRDYNLARTQKFSRSALEMWRGSGYLNSSITARQAATHLQDFYTLF
ncbi:hypothetical protein [Burkholderia glumae]|uniref:hypothetical protein n=1 Tax=Burkholderia glumae TaxID=337 RepID=UPI003B9D850E